jgi:SAM-dependent methyltransferase
MEYLIENWLNETEINDIEYSSYWNDKRNEIHKEWNILDGNFARMEVYLQKSGLLSDFEKAVHVLKKEFNKSLEGVGIDLGAGNLWAVPHILVSGKIERLYCLEYSRHRLLDLGLRVLEHYQIPSEKVVLVWGSFYDLRLPSESCDFAILSQAFHHADKPDELLKGIRRILKPGGAIVATGEQLLNVNAACMKHFIKFFISRLMPGTMQKKMFGRSFAIKRMIPRLKDLVVVDSILGDHFYPYGVYELLFKKNNFRMKYIKNSSRRASFILIKE